LEYFDSRRTVFCFLKICKRSKEFFNRIGGLRTFAARAPYYAKTKEADIHPSLEGDLSLRRRKSAAVQVSRTPCATLE